MRWDRSGVASMRRRTTGRKPRSAMWSASSSTVTSIASRKTCLLRRWSSRRPGHATRMSTPRRRALICGPAPTPPKTVVVLSPAALARGVIAAWIWLASSRVGARITRAAGPTGAARPRRPASPPQAGRRRGSCPIRCAAAQHIAAGQGVGQRRGLNRERRGDAVGGQHAGQGGWHAERRERGEGGGRRRRRSGCHSGGGCRGVRGAVARTGVRGAAVIRHRGTPKEKRPPTPARAVGRLLRGGGAGRPDGRRRV